MTKQKDMPMTFGKHKGKLICDLPDSYLEWLMEQDWFVTQNKTLAEQIVIEQKYRRQFDIRIKE